MQRVIWIATVNGNFVLWYFNLYLPFYHCPGTQYAKLFWMALLAMAGLILLIVLMLHVLQLGCESELHYIHAKPCKALLDLTMWRVIRRDLLNHSISYLYPFKFFKCPIIHPSVLTNALSNQSLILFTLFYMTLVAITSSFIHDS